MAGLRCQAKTGTQVNALIEHRHGPESARNCPASVTPLSGIYQAAQGEGTVASTQKPGGITLYFPLGCGCRDNPASRLQGRAPECKGTEYSNQCTCSTIWALAESFVEPISREQRYAEAFLPSRSFLQENPTPCSERRQGGQSRRLRTQRDAGRSCMSPTCCARAQINSLGGRKGCTQELSAPGTPAWFRVTSDRSSPARGMQTPSLFLCLEHGMPCP